MNLIQTKDIGAGSFVIIENDLIGQFILRHGVWEGHLANIYSQLINETDVILDAGANIGFHTVQFARFGKKVYAYDPQPTIFNLLSANILFNGATDKVEQFMLGLSDKPGSIRMEPVNKFDQPNGMHNFGGRGLTNDETGEESVELVTFDKDVDVIKIDIQGSEIYAFKGMEQMIDRCQPWIMFENYEDGENDKKVLDFLLNKGYVIYRLMNNLNEDCFAFKPELDNHKKVKIVLESAEGYEYKIHK
jgi:FkbM family methyltransferase